MALPAGAAAAARHRGLWNGLTNPGCPGMTVKLSAFFLSNPLPPVYKSTRMCWIVSAAAAVRRQALTQSGVPCAGVAPPPTLTIGLFDSVCVLFFSPPLRTASVVGAQTGLKASRSRSFRAGRGFTLPPLRLSRTPCLSLIFKEEPTDSPASGPK